MDPLLCLIALSLLVIFAKRNWRRLLRLWLSMIIAFLLAMIAGFQANQALYHTSQTGLGYDWAILCFACIIFGVILVVRTSALEVKYERLIL